MTTLIFLLVVIVVAGASWFIGSLWWAVGLGVAVLLAALMVLFLCRRAVEQNIQDTYGLDS
jgi:hypothetical protein